MIQSVCETSFFKTKKKLLYYRIEIFGAKKKEK